MNATKIAALRALIAQQYKVWYGLSLEQQVEIVQLYDAKNTEYKEMDPEHLFYKMFYPPYAIKAFSDPGLFTDEQLTLILSVLVNILTDIDDLLNTNQKLTWAEDWFSNTIAWAEVDILCQDLEF